MYDHPVNLPAYSGPWVAGILFASVAYMGALSVLNAHGLSASPGLIGAVEFLIYAACLVELRRSIGPLMLVAGCAIAGWLCLTWSLRGEVDLKSARDLIIPLLFLALGRHVADRRFADRVLAGVLGLVVVVALYELLFVESYASLFNTFSFYVNTGVTSADNAMFDDQMLTLNGFRPDGIGRTILPSLLGQHRVSSLLMEPVSLGNFALLLLAWALVRPLGGGLVARGWFVVGAVTLIALADSRFALMMAVPLVVLMSVPVRYWNHLSLLFPLLAILVLLIVSGVFPSHGDNLVGRLTHSGSVLADLPAATWFGLSPGAPGFWDMGYAYVLSRFGVVLAGALLLTLMLVPLPDAAAIRYRSFLLLYASAILLVSGSSFFALKTAGLLWFMLGVLSAPVVPAPGWSRTLDWTPRPTGMERTV